MSLPFIKIFLLQFFLWNWILPSSGQHKAWRQLTIDDGLPGNEVFDVFQDSRGFLWFVTDQGVCKFNGYEFIRPVDTSAFVGNEAFAPTEDAEGRIWFARLDKSLWVIEKDTVRPWEYNYVIDLYEEKFGLIDQLAVDENKTVWIALRAHGFLLVDSTGNHRVLRGSEHFNILFTKIGENVISATQFWETSGRRTWGPENTVDITYLERDQFVNVDQIKKSTYSTDLGSAWPLQNGDIVFSYNRQFEILRDTVIVSRFPTKFDNPKIFETDDGKIMVASYLGDHPGFFLYESIDHFQKGIGKNILPGYNVCDILIDREGGWWATTLDGGIFYCKNPDIDIYDKSVGFSSSNVLRLTNDGNQNVYASLQAQGVWKVNQVNANIMAVPVSVNSLRDISALYYDTTYNRLWRSPIEFLEDGEWKTIINPGTGEKANMLVKNFSPDPWGKSMWISTSYGFINVDNQTLKFKYFREGETNITALRTFSVAQDKQKNIWVATIYGLKLWKDDHYENPSFTHPVLRYQARDIEVLPDGSVIFAFRGGGILILDAEGNLEHLTKQYGLSSDFISKLFSTSDGQIYACSNEGLNHLSFQDNLWKIEVITTKQGLPSNLINDVTVLNGELWVATEKGLAQIKNKPAAYPVSTPDLEKFLINNRESVYSPQIRLPYNQNNITLKFYSLHFRSAGDILYRYRLITKDTAFIYTHNREVNFPNPSPGRYNLEVQARNENGSWSIPANWTFEVSNPWWLSVWFLSLSVMLLGISIGVFIHYRLKVIKKKVAINDKIKDLEMAALRAQMNPHFIFNCLGSIQQFIMENDSASATRYLSRFAKLIRLSLHSSVDGKHTLTEEVEMLDNYLALEHMRFKEKFIYNISISSDIEPGEVYLAPMLIQPFVENALLHGMKNKSKGGLINIDFVKENNTLLVSISDNGPGFSSNNHDQLKTHKSFGVSLTKKRLNMISGSGEGHNLTTENIMGPEGEMLGSRVMIRIPME
ncbi:MAG TPA: histidine kinase [Saprospiraceae bacterium]|nr:histidine kinase [Saprospiraceae bacterium]